MSSILFACDPQKGNDTSDTNDTGSPTDTQLDPNDYESGCFVVDGGNGFAKLNDAMLFVNTGSTIELNNCESTHEEAVVIEKSVTIIGPSSDLFTLIAPTNEHAFTIQAADVTISGLSIRSTRSGIFTKDATNIILEDISVLQAEQIKSKQRTQQVSVFLEAYSQRTGLGELVSLVEMLQLRIRFYSEEMRPLASNQKVVSFH